jgi:GNAT superfamily N-acetyltransferase
MESKAFQIKPIQDDEKELVRELVTRYWGSSRMVSRGRLVEIATLPGFLAWHEGHPAGVLSYEWRGTECEIVLLESLKQGIGIGSALISVVSELARQCGATRLWLITTNDNLHALRFYQRRGFHISAVYPDALETSRRLKPEIPLIGLDGIPLRDEIELELSLENKTATD